MGPLMVVFVEPALRYSSRLLDRIEQPPVQAAVAKDPIETLIVAILPRTARLNEVRLHSGFFQPPLDIFGDKFRTVVALDMGGQPHWPNKSVSTERTWPAVMLRETKIARPYRVYSSIIVKNFRRRPSAV